MEGLLVQPLRSSKAKSLTGTLTIPGDKSLSHRALILASQAIGQSTINGLLEGEDVLRTAEALRTLGVPISKEGDAYIVNGVGVGGLSEPSGVIDCGNSGTGVRLLMGLVASYPFTTQFNGDASLTKRPMGRVITPLERLGATVTANDGRLPLSVRGYDDMLPISYKLPVASAQVKSCVLLAGLNIAGTTEVIEPTPTRDHTERMLRHMGADITTDGNNIKLTGYPELKPIDYTIPADPSSAAFAVVAALITPNSEVTIPNVLMNEARVGLFEVLQRMGGDIAINNKRDACGEEVADLTVKSSQLKAVDVEAEIAPRMIDEYPILAIAAACAEGKTVMRGLDELRVKESDRLQAMYDGLQACGVNCSIDGDDLHVTGGTVKANNQPIATHMDHRIAMSFLTLGMVSDQPVIVDDGAMIATSFPGFVEVMNNAGAEIAPC